MALRTYGPQTLNDGWCEERAPALNGVVADYGNREYGTTFDDDFKKQKKQRAMWQRTQAQRRKKFGGGMISKETIQRHQKVADASAIQSFISKPRGAQGVFYDETTHGSGFGKGTKVTLQEKKLRGGRYARKAGVLPSNPKFKAAGTELTGERLKTGSDPANNTAAQRSWLYSADTMFQAQDILAANALKEKKEEYFATLPIKDGSMPKPAGRKSDNIKPGFNIWNNNITG